MEDSVDVVSTAEELPTVKRCCFKRVGASGNEADGGGTWSTYSDGGSISTCFTNRSSTCCPQGKRGEYGVPSIEAPWFLGTE